MAKIINGKEISAQIRLECVVVVLTAVYAEEVNCVGDFVVVVDHNECSAVVICLSVCCRSFSVNNLDHCVLSIEVERLLRSACATVAA